MLINITIVERVSCINIRDATKLKKLRIQGILNLRLCVSYTNFKESKPEIVSRNTCTIAH